MYKVVATFTSVDETLKYGNSDLAANELLVCGFCLLEPLSLSDKASGLRNTFLCC